jgi:hypothetical protein
MHSVCLWVHALIARHFAHDDRYLRAHMQRGVRAQSEKKNAGRLYLHAADSNAFDSIAMRGLPHPNPSISLTGRQQLQAGIEAGPFDR